MENGGYCTPRPRIDRSRLLSKRSCDVLPLTAEGDMVEDREKRQVTTPCACASLPHLARLYGKDCRGANC